MTVREYIEYLKTLDQDRGIWISYDGLNCDDVGYTNGIFKPTVDKDTVKLPLVEDANNDELKVGDYLISIG